MDSDFKNWTLEELLNSMECKKCFKWFKIIPTDVINYQLADFSRVTVYFCSECSNFIYVHTKKNKI